MPTKTQMNMKDVEMRLLKNVCNDLLIKQNYSLKKEGKMSGRTATVINWTKNDVASWLDEQSEQLSPAALQCLKKEEFDGPVLLSLDMADIKDLRDKYGYDLKLGDIKKLWLLIRGVQKENHASLVYLGIASEASTSHHHHHHLPNHTTDDYGVGRISPAMSVDGRATLIQPEFFKTMISLGESFNYSQPSDKAVAITEKLIAINLKFSTQHEFFQNQFRLCRNNKNQKSFIHTTINLMHSLVDFPLTQHFSNLINILCFARLSDINSASHFI
jgi:hypothetical protein